MLGTKGCHFDENEKYQPTEGLIQSHLEMAICGNILQKPKWVLCKFYGSNMLVCILKIIRVSSFEIKDGVLKHLLPDLTKTSQSSWTIWDAASDDFPEILWWIYFRTIWSQVSGILYLTLPCSHALPAWCWKWSRTRRSPIHHGRVKQLVYFILMPNGSWHSSIYAIQVYIPPYICLPWPTFTLHQICGWKMLQIA